MVQTLLVEPDVEAGQALVRFLDSSGVPPRAALWVWRTADESWRFWIVPPPRFADNMAFYREFSRLIATPEGQRTGFDPLDVQFATDHDRVVTAIPRTTRLPGLGKVRRGLELTDDGVIPQSIVLRMAL